METYYKTVLWNFVSNLFFTDIDFCKPEVIQGLELNLNLYLSTVFRGA